MVPSRVLVSPGWSSAELERAGGWVRCGPGDGRDNISRNPPRYTPENSNKDRQQGSNEVKSGNACWYNSPREHGLAGPVDLGRRRTYILIHAIASQPRGLLAPGRRSIRIQDTGASCTVVLQVGTKASRVVGPRDSAGLLQGSGVFPSYHWASFRCPRETSSAWVAFLSQSTRIGRSFGGQAGRGGGVCPQTVTP